VLITVLVCLVIVCGVATAALRVAILAVGQTRVDERASQAEWLAEAGLEWSRAKLKGDSAWTGETWRVSAAALSQPSGGEVVATIATAGSSKVLRVVARYPAGESRPGWKGPSPTLRPSHPRSRRRRSLRRKSPRPPRSPKPLNPDRRMNRNISAGLWQALEAVPFRMDLDPRNFHERFDVDTGWFAAASAAAARIHAD
jgi:type II secretory pathway pseudopilin PulG